MSVRTCTRQGTFTLTSGTDTIDMNPVRGTIQCDRLGHVDDRTLRGAIASEIACSHHTEDTCDIHNPATVAVWVRILVEHLP